MLRPVSLPLVLLLAACSESNAPACATQISDDVCATPAQLRGAASVQPLAGSTALTLPAAVLPEGRYVLVARSYLCPADVEVQAPGAVQGVLELSGCVLRRTLVGQAQSSASVEVFELSHAEQGVLTLQRRCPVEEAGRVQGRYGFDGEQLQLTVAPAADSEGPPPCDTLDTWELR